MNTLFIYGTPNDGKGQINVTPDGQTQILVSGSNNIGPFLTDLTGRNHRFCISGQTRTQSFQLNFWPNIIVNEISDPDTHSVALDKAISFCKQQNKPVFNDPAAIKHTRREHIYQRLNTVNQLEIPKTVRISPETPQEVSDCISNESLSYPVIFRQAGDHGGISTSLVENESELIKVMYRYPLDGRPYYITNFVDYASVDKLYRKCRLVVVDGVVYLRHLIISDSWLIHSSSRKFMNDNPSYNKEEADLLDRFDNEIRPQIASTIKDIANTLALDYFGIDCNIDDKGNILVFEINANMNILINNQAAPNRWQQPIEKIRQHLKLAIQKRERSGEI